MACDYEQIRRENIENYGKRVDKYGPVLLANLYSDRTHFVYELLQNAEDAGATAVDFQLRQDRLELRHDGRLFDDDDVRGICGLVEGTKATDLNKIGKFGIGFKSVYAFTSSPEVHSGDEHFCIEDYVRPLAIGAKRLAKGQTLIVLPFDHAEVRPTQAFEEISERLQGLGPRTLLFLRHIQRITWRTSDGLKGEYARQEETKDRFREVLLEVRSFRDELAEEWLVFGRPVRAEDGTELRVETAFLREVDDEAVEGRLVSLSGPAHLVVYFPTEIETHLGFLIQGPFRTTPARDNVPRGDRWNQNLVADIAELVSETLVRLRDMRLLAVGLLEALPIQSSEFPDDSMFRVVFERVRDTLGEKELLPTHDGHFVSARNAKLARSAALRVLLSDKELRQLFESSPLAKWLSDDISQDRTPALRKYLMEELKVQEIDPESFARRLTDEFIRKQSDQWLVRFYRFLADQRALWRPRGPLRRIAFLRLENGRHVTPFLEDEQTPRAYLPPEEGDTSLPTVKKAIAKDKVVMPFLRNLGLKPPDLVAEVLKRVLPKYCEGESVTDEQHQKDIALVFHAVDEASGNSRDQLLCAIQETPFVKAVRVSSGKSEFVKPGSVYVRSAALEVYFKGNPRVWFLDKSYDIPPERLALIGVGRQVRVRYRESNWENHVITVDRHSEHERGLDGFDPECTIEGLRHAVANPSPERSRYVWNELLMRHIPRIRGLVERSARRDFSGSQRRDRWSQMGLVVRDNGWLLGRDGEFHKPGELSLDDLPPGFERNEALAQQLQMKAGTLGSVAEEEGIEANDLRRLIECLKKNLAATREFVQQTLAAKAQPEDDEAEAVSYAEALASRFSRQGVQPAGENDGRSPDELDDPARRRGKTAEEISDLKKQEPPATLRFRRVPRKQWESKNNDVRVFLQEQYGGECQICGETFSKRDGEPYFEGLYLVSFTRGRYIDRPGNVLCLCATCCAKFEHGSVEAEDILEQVKSLRTRKEGGDGKPGLQIMLCDEKTCIGFTERHLVDLQELLKAAD